MVNVNIRGIFYRFLRSRRYVAYMDNLLIGFIQVCAISTCLLLQRVSIMPYEPYFYHQHNIYLRRMYVMIEIYTSIFKILRRFEIIVKIKYLQVGANNENVLLLAAADVVYCSND